MLMFCLHTYHKPHKNLPSSYNVVYIGYLPGMKAYKLLSIETQRIFVPQDVVFHEMVFPFHRVTKAWKQPDIFFDLALPTPFNVDLPLDLVPKSIPSENVSTPPS